MSEIVEIDKDTVDITVVDNNITLDVTTSVVSLSAASVGPQGIQGVTGDTGAQGPSGVVNVTSPITNSGTSTSAQLGFDQTAQNTTNDGRYARLASANAFTVGGHTITNNADVVALRINGNSTQTNNVLELRNNDNNIVHVFTNAGTLRSLSNLTAGTVTAGLSPGVVNAFSQGLTTIGYFYRAVAGSVGDSLQVQNSSSVNLGGRNANAQIYTGSTSTINSGVGGATTAATGNGTTATLTMTSATNLAVGDLIVVSTIEPAGYRTTGAVVTAVSNSGTFTVSYANTTTGAQTVAGTVNAPAQASITARSAGTIPLAVRSASSQSVNLQEWQNSGGTPLASVGTNGQAIFDASGVQNISISAGNTLVVGTAYGASRYNSAMFSVAALGQIGGAIRGSSTQAADLLQFQSSSGTVLGGCNAVAQIYTGTTTPLTTAISSGGTLTSASYVSATSATFTVPVTSQLFAIGQTITISGVTGGNYNQVVTVTAIGGSSGAFTFTATGTGFTNFAGTGGTFFISPSGTGTTATIRLVSASNLAVGDLINVSGFTGVTTYNTGTGVYAVVSAVSNTAPFTVSYANTSTGTATAGSINIPYQATINARSAGTPNLILNGPAGYTGNLVAFATGGVSFGRVDSGGLRIPSVANASTFANSNINLQTTGTLIAASTSTSTSIPLKIQNANAGTVTGDLTQWLNNTGGTVLAKVDASGNITAGSVNQGYSNAGQGTGAYTVPSTVAYLEVAGTPNIVLTLPTGVAGKSLWIRNVSAVGTVTSAAANVVQKTPAGSPTTAILPGTYGAWALLVYTGSAWQIMSSGT
jgi:hypothetical protein